MRLPDQLSSKLEVNSFRQRNLSNVLKTRVSAVWGAVGRHGPVYFPWHRRHPPWLRQARRAPARTPRDGELCTNLLAWDTPGRRAPRLSVVPPGWAWEPPNGATLEITKATRGERCFQGRCQRLKHLTLIRSRKNTKVQSKALWLRAPTYLSQFL